MNKYRLTQGNGYTFIERTFERVRTHELYNPNTIFISSYGPKTKDQGNGNHRKDYSDSDAAEVVRWLNDRAQGYPSMNYLALKWKVDDNQVSPERAR